jgi:dTDP-4-amino-4,6-dideoxygalactose transaminase
MIPHYSTPFPLISALGAMLSVRKAPTVDELEGTFAAQFGVRSAVILPAVRAGILMLLREATSSDGLVVGPAYTCLVVHEAVALSGARARYVEPSGDTLLMGADSLHAAAEIGCSVILSEMYGLSYSQTFLSEIETIRPSIRILDMAMGLPRRDRLQQLKSNDVALFSFGFGKALCSGGGGIAFLQDELLAQQIRKRRNDLVSEPSLLARLWGDLHVLGSVAIRTRLLCGATLALEERRHRTSTVARHKPRDVSAKQVSMAGYPSLEWTHVMSPLERRLAKRNMRMVAASTDLRRRQSERYVQALDAFGIVPDFGDSGLPESHFPIQVEPSIRAELRRYLRLKGIDAGEEFEFSGLLERSRYPQTYRACSRTLRLPLGEHVSMSEVELTCARVIEALSHVTNFSVPPSYGQAAVRRTGNHEHV